MSIYRVKLKPLEYYFFGSERNYDFGQGRNVQRNTYFIESEEMPTQTTLLGIIRFLVLKKANKLNDSNNFSNELKEQKELIGENSFNINATDKQMYGKIKRIGPLFLIDEEENYYITTPFNHNNVNKEVYEPLEMQQGIVTELGQNSILPKDFDAKEGMADSFVKLTKEKTIIPREKIFTSDIRTGVDIQKNMLEENNEAFFKKQYKNFALDHKDKSFAFFVEVDDENVLPSQEIIYCGKEKSMFLFECKKQKDDLIERIEATLEKTNVTYYYALSDIKFNEQCEIPEEYYGMVRRRPFRYLQTNLGEKQYYKRLQVSSYYQLIRAGSTFFVSSEEQFKKCYRNNNYEKIGLNQIIKVEGKR